MKFTNVVCKTRIELPTIADVKEYKLQTTFTRDGYTKGRGKLFYACLLTSSSDRRTCFAGIAYDNSILHSVQYYADSINT